MVAQLEKLDVLAAARSIMALFLRDILLPELAVN